MNDIEKAINEWIITHTETAITMAYLFIVLMVIAMVLVTWFITNMIYKITNTKKNKRNGVKL